MTTPPSEPSGRRPISIDAVQTPLLIVLSGPSGVGKTTLTRHLVGQGWTGHVMVTVTTRRPRPGEEDGVHYHFRTAEQFHEMLQRNELLEHAEVHGNWYGVPSTMVRERLDAGQDVILTIDPQGAQTVRSKVEDAVFIFLAPESLDVLTRRVDNRGHDSPEQRALRLLNAEREMAELPKYDYLIVNQEGRLDEAANQLRAILCAEHSRVFPRRPKL
ncbi:MAG TPA: guanylate kinase [Ktedonobacterales bacterium]|nr:guanylate kinase [Ktedonobacterales bacterium]